MSVFCECPATRVVAVCGNIGSGKSTVCELLAARLNATYVREYIDRPGGPGKLADFIAGRLPPRCFQEFILSSTARELARAAVGRPVVLERTPTEGILVFARGEEAFGELLDSARCVERKFGVAPVSEAFRVSADRPADVVVRECLAITRATEGPVTIFLDAPSATCVSRLFARGRTSELGYTLGYLRDIARAYDHVFAEAQDSELSEEPVVVRQ